jgi:hypothetical protein
MKLISAKSPETTRCPRNYNRVSHAISVLIAFLFVFASVELRQML